MSNQKSNRCCCITCQHYQLKINLFGSNVTRNACLLEENNERSYDGERYSKVIKEIYGDKIFCHCLFEFKDKLKTMGFKWCPKNKSWFIEVDKLTKEVYEKTKAVRFSKNSSSGVLEYYYVHYKTVKELNDELLEN